MMMAMWTAEEVMVSGVSATIHSGYLGVGGNGYREYVSAEVTDTDWSSWLGLGPICTMSER